MAEAPGCWGCGTLVLRLGRCDMVTMGRPIEPGSVCPLGLVGDPGYPYD